MSELPRSVAVIVLVFAVIGCGPRYRPAHGVVETAPPAPAPPDEQATPDLTPLEWVVAEITAAGYTCTLLRDAVYGCTTPDDTWTVEVAFVWYEAQGEWVVVLDSYWLRAFGQPCSTFQNHIADLDDAASRFVVSCEDEAQRFRMDTAVPYVDDVDWAAWFQSHREKRYHAFTLLSSVNALRN
jgi:hypothetical protein